MTTLAEAAVRLAARGSRVFPVAEDKAPRTARGHLDATSDRALICAWDEVGLWDGGGIGLLIPERTFVVDVDPRNGGVETLEALVDAHNTTLPRTRVVLTGGGGTHHYFALPDDRELRGRLGPGIDIKKPGRGYVLVPPSPGYSYIRGGKPAPAPQWLLDELTLERRNQSGESSAPKYFPFVGATPYGAAALKQKLEQVRNHDEGGRRANLNACAFVLATLTAGGELCEEKTLAGLLEAAMDSGLTESQALAAMRSGWAAGLRHPRQAE